MHLTYFLSSRAMWRLSLFCREKPRKSNADIGVVSCYGNDVDDLTVNTSF